MNIKQLLLTTSITVLITTMVSAQPEWIKNTGAKSFPNFDREISVNDLGAYKNKFFASTEIIQKAIDSVSALGGGKVTFEPGVYHTGALFLKDNVNFHIGEGVELRALIGLEYYPEIKTRVAGIFMQWPCGVINILDQKNVAITGKGTIHGQGKIHWERYWNLRQEYTPRGLRWASDYDCKRVRTIEISDCENITVKDITIKQSGFWTVHMLFSNQVTVDGVIIRNNIDGEGPSTDGIDIDSSTNIEVMNCDTDCNDDNYCVKAGRDADGIRINRPSEYVYIHDCIARKGGGLLVIGSETSGWIRHVYTENMKAIGTKNVLYLKSAKTRGGGIEDIVLKNVEAEGVRDFCGATVNWNPNYSYASLKEEVDSIPYHWKILLEEVPEEIGLPHIRDVKIYNCNAKGVRKVAFNIKGIEQTVIKNFEFNNCNIEAARTGEISFAENITFNNVSITSDKGEKLKILNSKNIDTKTLTVTAK